MDTTLLHAADRVLELSRRNTSFDAWRTPGVAHVASALSYSLYGGWFVSLGVTPADVWSTMEIVALLTFGALLAMTAAAVAWTAWLLRSRTEDRVLDALRSGDSEPYRQAMATRVRKRDGGLHERLGVLVTAALEMTLGMVLHTATGHVWPIAVTFAGVARAMGAYLDLAIAPPHLPRGLATRPLVGAHA